MGENLKEELKAYVENESLILQGLEKEEIKIDEQKTNNSAEVRIGDNVKLSVTGMLGNELLSYIEPQQETEYTR